MIGSSHNSSWVLMHKIEDKNVRYIVLRGFLNSRAVTLVGIYVPHVQQTLYWEEVFSQLPQET